MDPLATFLAVIPGGGKRVGGEASDRWVCRCPAHPDKRPSLAVRVAPDGTLLVRCHAGCATEAVLDALALSWRDLYPDRVETW